MVHWGWVVGALFGGAFFGMFITALCVASGSAEKHTSSIEWPKYPR